MTGREWECAECGRRHPKHSPPCSRCGATTLSPVEASGGEFNERAFRLARLRNKAGTLGQWLGFVAIGAGALNIWRQADWIRFLAQSYKTTVPEVILTQMGLSVALIVGGIVWVLILTYPFERHI